MRRLVPVLVLAVAVTITALAFALDGGGDGGSDGGDETARAAAPRFEPAVELPGLAVVEWRCDDRRRFEVAIRVPKGAATTELVGRSGRERRLQPGDTARERVGEGRAYRVRIVQRTSPMTRSARIELRFGVRPETGLCVLEDLQASEERQSNVG